MDNEDLTGSGVVGEFSFPFEGRFDCQRTCLRDVHNLEVALTVQRLLVSKQTSTG